MYLFIKNKDLHLKYAIPFRFCSIIISKSIKKIVILHYFYIWSYTIHHFANNKIDIYKIKNQSKFSQFIIP